MKIQQIAPQIQQIQHKQNLENHKQNSNDNVKFTGAFDAATVFLRFLDTNQAWGANAVDLGSMVIPRTTIDMVKRGPAAGMETGRREASGTINHSLVGVYGTLAGLAIATALNKKYGIKAHKIFVDDDTIQLLGKAWDKQVKAGNKEPLEAYLKDVFNSAETRIGDDWVKIPENNVADVVEKFSKVLNKEDAPVTISKDLKAYARSVITNATGSENTFRLGKDAATASLENIIESVYNVSRTFVNKNENIAKEFAKDFKVNKYIADLKHMNLGRSVLGIGIASAVGMSIQPLNIYLTKKKTGSDGFVGVEGREKDYSAGFKALKVGAAALFGGGILASLGMRGGFKGILKKIQFKGLVPTLDQFKFIYGVTIMSRFIVARDKDELRESVVKDVLGFFNWLILGNFVAKIAANAIDQNLLNYSEKEHGKGFFNKVIKAPLVTRDEVLHRGLKAAGINPIEDGKALSFKQLMKKLSSTQVSEAIRKETKGKLRALNIAQVAGYLYSGLVLGAGIPRLNIYMTDKSEQKRKAKLAAAKAQNQGTAAETATSAKQSEQHAKANAASPTLNEQYQAMIKPENLAFLSGRM